MWRCAYTCIAGWEGGSEGFQGNGWNGGQGGGPPRSGSGFSGIEGLPAGAIMGGPAVGPGQMLVLAPGLKTHLTCPDSPQARRHAHQAELSSPV